MTPLVFVHGNPENDAVWDLLAAALFDAGRTEQVRLSPPGFGASVPAGFEATPQGYRDWLAAELERIGEPVDLVGHDLGGRHVVNLVAARPELVRSWSSDAIGSFHPAYVWHELAQIWQTPEAGERFMAERLAAGPEAGAAYFVGRGMDAAIAARVASAFDEAMATCILRCYRGTQLGGFEAAAARPGLVFLATDDNVVGTDEQRREAAAMAGAQVVELEGAGHWWMTQPVVATAAAALIAFWG
jgi:pimeloyl-ACP methyl ester carboxylesterase